mgnify:CR=1 FL=1
MEKLVERGITSKDPIESRQELITEIINLDAEIVGFEFQLLEYEKMLILFNEKLTMLPKKQMELSAMIRDSEILTENYFDKFFYVHDTTKTKSNTMRLIGI